MDKKALKKKCKGIILCLLSVMLVITAMPVTVSAYDRVSDPWYEDEWDFIKSFKLKNSKQQAILEYVYADYMSGHERYKGSGQCYGYAESIRKLFGKGYKQRNYGVKPTKKNVYNKLKKLKPGTHVRFSAKKNGGGTAHSIVLLKITKDEIWYTDGNVDWNNGIRYGREPLSELCARQRDSGRKYLAWTREPKGGVPSVKNVSVKTNASFEGPETHVAWLPVKGAKKYVVYRSSLKKSGYVKIAETKSLLYIDKSENLYGKAFYKVKALKSGGKSVSSKPVKALRKLKAPIVYLTEDNSTDTTQYVFSWAAVPGAVKYKIYKYDTFNDKTTLIKTVSGTNWRYTGSTDGFVELYISAESSRAGSESFPAYIYF